MTTRVVQAVAGLLPPKVEPVQVDITDEHSFAVVLAKMSAFHQLDVLINNAGIMWIGSFLKRGDVVVDACVEVSIVNPISMRSAADRPKASGLDEPC